MARPKREAPPKAKLLALFEEHEGKIAPIATELKASWGHTKRWLVDAGIINSLGQPTSEYNFEWYAPKKKQTQPPEPEELGGTDPVQEEKEPADDSISYSVERIENIGKDIPPVKMPIGCSLPLEDSTEPQDEVMAESDTVGEEEAEEYVTLDIEWPPTDKVEKALIEASINATFAVRRVLNDPVALALMKQVLETGVVYG